MARRKKVVRRRTRTVAPKRRRKKSSGVKAVQVDAMLYGALRSYTSAMLAPYTNKLPLGDVSDEVGMSIVNYFVAKKVGGKLGKIAKMGLVVENARLGEYLSQRLMNRTGGQTTSSVW